MTEVTGLRKTVMEEMSCWVEINIYITICAVN